MENFVVSARKYRPDTFGTVVGQHTITSTLKNAIKTGHIAQAYLFCGPRGVGKTTCARILAKTINCLTPTDEVEACNTCESCVSFNSHRSYNIHELDAASNNSVDDIRTLIEQVRIPPQLGKYSIYIIDEVHMLSQQAFNAFLKTLEEPPAHAIFILATTEKHKILPTILSRCQIFDFNRITIDDTVGFLEGIAQKENIEAERDALNIIAQKADGAMRDALSIFDQIVSFSDNNITYKGVIENLNVLDYEYYFRLTEAFLQGDISFMLLTFNSILENGFDAHNFINGLASHFRDLLVCRDEITLKLLEIGDNIKKKYLEQSKACDVHFLFDAIKICNDCDLNYRISRNKRLHVEFALIELCRIKEQAEKKNDKSQVDSIDSFDIAPGKPAVSPVKRETSAKLPEPAKKQAPIGNTSIKQSISLKQAFQKASTPTSAPVEQTSSVSEIPDNTKTDFTAEQLSQEWEEFTNTLQKSVPRMYASLKSISPQLKDNYVVEIQFPTNILIEDFKSKVQSKLLAHLKSKLNNSFIELNIVLTESKSGQEEGKLYTEEDKFKYMSEKNPNLLELKQRFNLDYD